MNSHSAPGQAAGVIFQFQRALYWLATSPRPAIIGLETDDDVVVRRGDQPDLYEQDKHSIREGGNPFSDRSVNLWKTLQIWLEAVNSGKAPLECSCFLLVTNQKVKGDCLVRKISEAREVSQLDDCIEALRAIGKNPSKSVRNHVNYVLGHDAKTLRGLLKRVELVDRAAYTPGNDLIREVIAHLMIPSGISGDRVANALWGWLERVVMTSWQAGENAWITKEAFDNEYHAVIESLKRDRVRERSAHVLPVTSEQVGQERGRTFVEQLNLIELDEEHVDDAIKAWVRCNMERLRLSSEGELSDEDWIAFDSELFQRWKSIFQGARRRRKDLNDTDLGFHVYDETTRDYRGPLAGRNTDHSYLTVGTYHRKAENLQLGWHPKYQELLKVKT